jgi:putative transposase
VALIEGMALQVPAPSVATIHRQLASVAAEQGWSLPSYSTVYSIVRGLDPAMVTLAREGTKRYEEVYDLVYRRQAAAAGYTVSLEDPSALHTALALRQAIWRKPDPAWSVCGIPDLLYVDHGPDFTSRHLEQVADDLHIRLIFSGKGKPRGRGKVQRLFDSVNQICLQALPGYAPVGTPDRAERARLSLPDLDAAIGRFLTSDYHQRIHSETGQAPGERWAAGGFLPRMPDSLEQLDLLLLTVAKPRKIHPDGVHFQGLRYLDPTLAAYVGEQVTIRYDPRDLAEIRIFHHEAFLSRAICPELAGHTIAL